MLISAYGTFQTFKPLNLSNKVFGNFDWLPHDLNALNLISWIQIQYNPDYSSPQGPKKSDEYTVVTNKPNAITMYLNGKAISRGFENVANMPVGE